MPSDSFSVTMDHCSLTNVDRQSVAETGNTGNQKINPCDWMTNQTLILQKETKQNTMKKTFLFLALALMPLLTSAQSLKFAYFSYNEVLQSMADYATVVQNMKDLRAKYDAETQRSEKDFHAKYENFLEEQRNLAPSILKKRQAEIQEMMYKNMAFKKESQKLLEQAEKQAFAPVHQRLRDTVSEMGRESGYAFILNTDDNALPYVDATMGENITEALKTVLK